MSDYNPGPGGPYDKYGNTPYDPVDTGRGPYVLLGILVAIGLIGGLLYFNGGERRSERTNQAAVPMERTLPTPAPAPMPAPAPAAPTTTDEGAPQKQ